PWTAPRDYNYTCTSQLSASRCQEIAEAAPPLCRSSFDDAGDRERGEALRQQIARDPRKSDLKLAEPMAAVEELAQDERRPALSENLRSTRHRAELAVFRHPHSQRLASPNC